MGGKEAVGVWERKQTQSSLAFREQLRMFPLNHSDEMRTGFLQILLMHGLLLSLVKIQILSPSVGPRAWTFKGDLQLWGSTQIPLDGLTGIHF